MTNVATRQLGRPSRKSVESMDDKPTHRGALIENNRFRELPRAVT